MATLPGLPDLQEDDADSLPVEPGDGQGAQHIPPDPESERVVTPTT